MMFKEREIKIYIMRNENRIVQKFKNLFGDIIERWRIGHHVVVDSGERLNVPGDRHAGINKGFKSCYFVFSRMQYNSNFCYCVICCITTCSFYINDSVQNYFLKTHVKI